MGDPYNGSNGSANLLTRPINNSALRRIEPWLGSGPEWSVPHRGYMVSRGGYLPHQLPGVASLFSGYKSLREDLAEHYSLAAYGQRYSSELHKSERGTVSKPLCQLTITIWTWCTERNITLQAEHLPRQLNSQADEESRTVRDCCDWKLNQSVFQQIRIAMEVDLFVSRLARQLPHFYSWRPDPEAETTDAFMHQFRGLPILHDA